MKNATSTIDELAKQFGIKVKRTAASLRNIMTYEKIQKLF
jgi:hypothetical protein